MNLELIHSEDWVEPEARFYHLEGKVFTNFKEVGDEIVRKTQENVGSKNTVVNKPIYLSITSNKVPNLTLIDLPGITKVAVQGQSDEICKDIDNLVDEYIEKPNTIILAVSPANANIATSDALMLARKYDSEQSRTFGVTLFYLAFQIKITLKLKS